MSQGAESKDDTSGSLQTPVEKNLSQLCEYFDCTKKALNLTCGRCQKRQYCSKVCQKKDWSMHKLFCNKEERGMTGVLKGYLHEIQQSPSMVKDLLTASKEFMRATTQRGAIVSFVDSNVLDRFYENQEIDHKKQYLTQDNKYLDDPSYASVKEMIENYDHTTEAVLLLVHIDPRTRLQLMMCRKISVPPDSRDQRLRKAIAGRAVKKNR